MMVQYLKNVLMWAEKAVGKQALFSCHYKTVSEENNQLETLFLSFPFLVTKHFSQDLQRKKRDVVCDILQTVK